MPRPAEWCEHECEKLRTENERLLGVCQDKTTLLKDAYAELEQSRTDAAKVVHALDCAVQTVDALIAWMPEGLNLSPGVATCKHNLDEAMRAVMGRE
jgi:hypothetical protein